MADVEHDPQTGLMSLHIGDTVRVLDAQDLAAAGAVLIRCAAV